MKTVDVAVNCVLKAETEIGEGVFWSERNQAIYFVDIPRGCLHRYEPASGNENKWEFGRPLGCAAETRSGRFVLALTDGFFEFDASTQGLAYIGGPKPGDHGHRFNDGVIDSAGRFMAGTMPLAGGLPEDTSGALYELNPDGAVNKTLTGFHVINGMAFSPDGRTGYVSDSFPTVRTIWSFDYDPATGERSDRRIFFDTRGVAGRPDGAITDAEGCYWMAGVGGWQLVRLTPKGDVDMIVPMPVEKPTKIAFGGAGLDTMFVTSIAAPGDGEQPLSGGLFALRIPGVRGFQPWVMDR